MFFVYTFLIPWCGYVMWCIVSLFHFILVSMQFFILFPFWFLFSMFFPFPLPSFSLSPFLLSFPFTFLCRSSFFLPYCRIIVLLLLFITFLFSVATFLHTFSSRAFLTFHQLVLPPCGSLELMLPFTFVVVTVGTHPKGVFPHDMRCPCFRCSFPLPSLLSLSFPLSLHHCRSHPFLSLSS